MFTELKNFLFRGDVLSLAVAVIIAGAFGKIIDSMVADLVSPLLALATGNPDFSKSLIFGSNEAGEGGFRIGSFIQAIINFIMIGTVLFMLVKGAGKKAEDVK